MTVALRSRHAGTRRITAQAKFCFYEFYFCLWLYPFFLTPFFHRPHLTLDCCSLYFHYYYFYLDSLCLSFLHLFSSTSRRRSILRMEQPCSHSWPTAPLWSRRSVQFRSAVQFISFGPFPVCYFFHTLIVQSNNKMPSLLLSSLSFE